MAIAASDTYKSLGAADATVDLAVGGYGTVGIQVAGTWAGTITFEGTVDTGTWQTLSATLTNSTARVTTTTGNGIWTASVAGLRKVRARMSVYTSGTANVQLLVVGVGGGSSGGGGGVGSDVNLIEVGGAAIALGETTMAASVPVVIASNQTAIPITGSISATNPSVGPTADPVPAEATYIGADDGTGDLAGLALAKLDYATDGSTVAQSLMGLALPGTTGPVAGGTSTNPVIVGGSGTAGTAAASVVTVQGIASMTPVQVSQATAANLNATVVGTGTFAVQTTAEVPGTGATNLGKAEDAGHTTGDTGVAVWGVRNTDQNAAVTSADSDYSQLSTTKTGAVNMQFAAEDFAVLGSNFVNKPFNLTGAQTDAIIWSPAAGKRWYVTSFYYCVSAAAEVTFEDDQSGGDVFMGIGGAHAANSGAACASLRTPLFSGEDAADLVLTTSAGNIKGFVSGYEV